VLNGEFNGVRLQGRAHRNNIKIRFNIYRAVQLAGAPASFDQRIARRSRRASTMTYRFRKDAER